MKRKTKKLRLSDQLTKFKTHGFRFSKGKKQTCTPGNLRFPLAWSSDQPETEAGITRKRVWAVTTAYSAAWHHHRASKGNDQQVSNLTYPSSCWTVDNKLPVLLSPSTCREMRLLSFLPVTSTYFPWATAFKGIDFSLAFLVYSNSHGIKL